MGRRARSESAHAPGAPPKRTRRSWFRLRHLTPAAVWLITHRTAREFASDRCSQMAAGIAYYVLFAIVPLMGLLAASFGLLLRDPLIQRHVVIAMLEHVPMEPGLVVDAIRALSEASQSLTVLGLLVLLWTSSGMMGAVRDALNVAWGVRSGRNPLRQKLFDLVATLGLGVLLGASVFGTMALHALRSASALVLGAQSSRVEFVWSALGWASPSAVTFVAFLLLYRYLPRVQHGYRDVWPGALVATILFELAKHGFAIYVASFSRFEMVYGALGAVMLFLLWVYVSALVLLVGAEMASVYERALRGRTATTRPHPDLVLRPRPT